MCVIFTVDVELSKYKVFIIYFAHCKSKSVSFIRHVHVEKKSKNRPGFIRATEWKDKNTDLRPHADTLEI